MPQPLFLLCVGDVWGGVLFCAMGGLVLSGGQAEARGVPAVRARGCSAFCSLVFIKESF